MIANEITAGDSLDWDESESDYLASDGWSIKYVLVNASYSITITSSASGDDHNFTIATATTETWNAGDYNYQRYAVKTGERVTLLSGTVTIKPNFEDGRIDARTQAKQDLDAVRTALSGRITKDYEGYTIGGRSLTKIPIADLIALRDSLRAEVAREEAAERISQGLGTRQTIKVRF